MKKIFFIALLSGGIFQTACGADRKMPLSVLSSSLYVAEKSLASLVPDGLPGGNLSGDDEILRGIRGKLVALNLIGYEVGATTVMLDYLYCLLDQKRFQRVVITIAGELLHLCPIKHLAFDFVEAFLAIWHKDDCHISLKRAIAEAAGKILEVNPCEEHAMELLEIVTPWLDLSSLSTTYAAEMIGRVLFGNAGTTEVHVARARGLLSKLKSVEGVYKFVAQRAVACILISHDWLPDGTGGDDSSLAALKEVRQKICADRGIDPEDRAELDKLIIQLDRRIAKCEARKMLSEKDRLGMHEVCAAAWRSR